MISPAAPTTTPRFLGTTILPGAVRFDVWAPKATRVEVELEPEDGGPPVRHPLVRQADGLHAGTIPGLGAGSRYRYRLDGGGPYPDPWSRSQPTGPHGPSAVVDPAAFAWTDGAWPGITMDGLAIYELHVGTFTAAGTFAALIPQLPELQRLGVGAIELMPVTEFPGRWNWGYDGVDLFAPFHGYGTPDDLRRLVAAAHRVGLGVILDVVYNHLGPDGNYLRAFSDDYFTDRHCTPWGDAVNFDGPNNRFVRDFVVGNACHWVSEYHLDGLRLDATHAIVDDSPRHVLAELAEAVRAVAAPRRVVVIAEDERNEVRLVRPAAEGGYELDGTWADDFHHAVWVHLTGERAHYFAGYEGTTAEIATTINAGFHYQGQRAAHTGEPKGTAVRDEPAASFVFCLQNHDQVGNRAHGERLHHLVDRASANAAAALLLLAPETPLLFMGEEFAASAPFLYFTDHEPELGKLVTEGRRREFAELGGKPGAAVPDPQTEETFRRSKLDLTERTANAGVHALYRELLRLRRADPVLSVQDRTRSRAVAAGERVVAVHRWAGDDQRLLLVNFGEEVAVDSAALPPTTDSAPIAWEPLFSTANPTYGGSGEVATLEADGATTRFRLPARSAVLLGTARG